MDCVRNFKSTVLSKDSEEGKNFFFDVSSAILCSQRRVVGVVYRTMFSVNLKETVSRDFRPMVFFINQLTLGPCQ
jgi:hypothetical protein